MRVTFYEDEDFILQYKEAYGEVFLHCEVTSWKPSSFKKGLRVFGALLNKMEERGRTRLVTVTPNPKFVQLLGGEYIGDKEQDGIHYEVYQWVLK